MKSEGNGFPQELFSYFEVAEMTTLSERTIWSLVKSGELGSLKQGRRVLIPRVELRKWIERKTKGGGDAGRAEE